MSDNQHLDQYFTPVETAAECVDWLLRSRPDWAGMPFVEPSAGAGSFLEASKARGLRIAGLDLEPQHPEVIQANFLTDGLDLRGRIVIGNPPYGDRNELTLAFINRAFQQGAHAVAFLLLGSTLSATFMTKLTYCHIAAAIPVRTNFLVEGKAQASISKTFTTYFILFERGTEDPFAVPERVRRARSMEDANTFFAHEGHGVLDGCPIRFWTGASGDMYYNVPDTSRIQIAQLYRFADIRDYLDNLDLIQRFADADLGGKPSAATLNFWLEHRDRLSSTEIDTMAVLTESLQAAQATEAAAEQASEAELAEVVTGNDTEAA